MTDDGWYRYGMFTEEAISHKNRAMQLCGQLNGTDDPDEKIDIIRALFGSVGKNIFIAPGFYCDWGKNIFAGDDVLINYNVVILDDAPVHIGNNCMIAPGVLITAVGHPTDPQGRLDSIAQAKPVVIGDNVWIGGNSTILPGVTIGKNVVVAGGSVVNRDIPDNCIVAGVPAHKVKDVPDNTV
jgi:maltose O-acetyltransferase